jgi:cholesterol oxidase
VQTVRDLTGATDVQVTAHCVGSLSLVMSLTAGLKGIRSAVCSQIALHPMVSSMVRAKTALRLATVVKALGPDFIATAHDDRKLTNRLLDKAMDYYPGAARCGNPVCDRILFYYGETYEHAQLNDETHGIIVDMFGPANLTTFQHMARIINAGHAVDAQGEEAYLPNVSNAAVPICFIHGEVNNFFLPEGTKRTYELLCTANGPELYSRHVFPGYAHMDCFIGKNAAHDIFPVLHEELEKFN